MYANNRISTIVETQLPEFIRADHPNFVALLKKYYEYLEQDGKTNQVNKNLYEYADVDTTRDDLVKYFKTKIIPNFPDETSLSKAKIIKASREFYAKKGTAESFKFLFKILYGIDIDVYFPKDDILKVSDGKWQLPQAIRLSFSDASTLITSGNVNVFVTTANTVTANGFNLVTAGVTSNSYIRIDGEKRRVVSVNASGDYLLTELPFANTGNAQIYTSADLYKVTLNQYTDFDVSLLNKRKAVGEISRTSCIIEKAIRSIDKTTGYQIAELYVSNINKLFENGENLLVDYVDTQGIAHTFSSKIISLISNIRLYRNRFGVYQTGKRYHTGDPVSIIGGLANADDTIRAVALVGNVSTGSIQSMDVLAAGYFFRPYENSAIRLYSTSGIGANAYVDTIWDDGGANSENFAFNTDSIAFKMAHMIYDPTNDIYTFANTSIPTVSLSRPITLPGVANVNAAAGFANVYIAANVSNNTTPSFNLKYGNTITIGANTFLVNVVAANGLMMTVNSISNTAYTFTYTVSGLAATKIDLSGDYTAANQTTTRVNVNSTTYIANTTPDFYKSYVLKVTEGKGSAASPNTSLILGSNANGILNLTTALGSALDGTSNVIIYANAQTQIGKAFSYSTFALGKIRSVILENGGSFFEAPPETSDGTIDVDSLYDTDYSIQGYLTIPGSTSPAGAQFSNYNINGTYPTIQLSSSNSVYSLANGFYTGVRLWLDVGETSHYVKITDYVVNNPGSSSNTKTLVLDTLFENNVTPTNITRFNMFMDFRESVKVTGKIGVVLVNNGGTGYSASDLVGFVGTGYDATATLSVSGGVITAITITNRGEGYYAMPTVVITNSAGANSSGSGASFTAIGLSDGEDLSATTNDIGRIQDFNIINRGFDYATTPLVSLKNMDVLTNDLQSNQIVLEGQSVWQGGSTNAAAVFKATVDDVYRANAAYSVIRLYNYSGTVNTALPLQVNTSAGNIAVTALLQTAAISFNKVSPAVDVLYPHYYGDGLAKANAEFLNGLIQYNGYYLNSDGFISADKKIQNNNYFHNFSYEIQAEKSLSDYSKTVYSTAHPAGMQLLSKYLIKDLLPVGATVESKISLTNPSAASTNVTVGAFDTGGRAFIRGSMGSIANVGDTIWIGGTLTERYQLKVITGVANTNTTPSMSMDFTANTFDMFPANTTILTLESNTAFIGDGRIRSTNNSNILYVSGNTSSLDSYIATGDFIRFNIADYRTNLLTYSEEFDQAIWGKTSSTVTANTVVAPDGTTTGDTFTEVAATAQHIIQQVITPISGREYTMSAYLKANTGNYGIVGLSGGGMGDVYVAVDLTTGFVTATLGTPTAYTVTNVGSGWWRISCTKTTTSTGSMGARLWLSDNGVNSSYAGSATRSIYIWGGQLEYASTPNGYIPTTSVSVKSSTSANAIYTSNVVAISGNTIQVNTQEHLFTSNSTNRVYQVFPIYDNTTYQIITSAP